MAKKDKNSLLNIHYSRTMTSDNLSKAANYVGNYVLKGLGAFGKIMTAPFVQQGPTSATIYKSKELLAKERTIENKSEELLGKAMTWASPLNYGVALATGNGLNARKGEEEVASWSPAWLALGRAAELYVGPKAVKGVKYAPRVVVNTAAKAGVKPAKVAVVAREINRATKLGVQNINLRPKILNYDLLANNYGFPKLFKELGAESEQRAFLGEDGYVYKIPKYGGSDGTFVTKNMSINRLPDDLGAKTEFLGMRKNPDGTKTPIIRLEYVNPIKSRLLYLDLMKDYNYNDEFHFILFNDKGFVDDIRPSNVGTVNGKLKIFDIGTYETPKSIQKPAIKTTRQEPSTSLKFFERKPSKISEAERAGVPKGERNVKQGYLLKDAIEEANKFAEKWGYDKLSQNATLLDIENLYNQHNTFFRGVTTEQLENTRNRVAKELGINPELLTNDLYLLYVSTHPWPGNDRIWVTPFSHYGKIYENSDMFGGKGLLSAVMRPWKTTKDIKQWPKLSLWTLGFKEDVSNPVITPWVSNAPDAIRSLGSLSEFLVKSPLIYRGLGKDFKGTLLLQLKYNDGQGKLGWIESLVGELPLEIIIEKQGGKMNILEFLKNGSGIHIKEENKGKFTSYCGGKVTNECILKGKNSSNPAIRKRATFADNARHFKHRLGGSILEAEKTIIRKEGGILKAQLGLGLTLFNDPENPNAVGGDIVNSYIRNQLMIPYLLALKEEYEKWKLKMKLQSNTLKSSLFDNLLNTGLSIGTDYLKSKLGI